EASVFIFEKKIADKIHKPRRRETVSEVLRKEVQYLQKIKHPKFLGILHPLEECHNNVAFATEPIYASLANLLGDWERMPQQIPQEIKDYELIELEIKYGILQMTEALSYLHSTEQLMHRNVSPQSILLTKRGSWKLAGLGFAEKIRDGKDSIHCQPWTSKIPKMAQPDLNYFPPETQLHKTCSTLSDMFSLGMVVCAIFNGGNSLIDAEHNTSQYLKQVDQLTHKFGEVVHRMPMELVEAVEKMINKDVRYRPTPQLFSLVKYFNNPLVSCLEQLDIVDQRGSREKAEIYATLSALIPNMPK
ncbi:hypothetical protein ScPMuIL_006427, partial [Solemya velum]